MKKSQQAILDILAKIPSFLDDHASELYCASRSAARVEIEALVRHLTARAREQVGAVGDFRLCAQRRRALREELFGRHLLPLAAVAQAAFSGTPMAAAFRAPWQNAGFAEVLERAKAISEQAAKHRTVFLREGLERDFGSQLRDVIAAMDRLGDERAERIRGRKAATAALAVGCRRAKGLVSVIDALVERSTTNNPALRAEWDAITRGGTAAPRLELVASDAA